MRQQRASARAAPGGAAGVAADVTSPGAGTWRPTGTPGALEEIGEDECLSLLGAARFGRLVVSGTPPQVFPVNFVLDGRCLVIRTAPGTKIDAVRRDAHVAFEVDQVDPVEESGWSVVVTGRVSEEIHMYDDSPRPRPEPWSEGLRPYWLRLTPTTMTGRRVRRAPGGAD